MGSVVPCIKQDKLLTYTKEELDIGIYYPKIIKCTNKKGSTRYYTRSRKNSYGNINDK